MLSKRSCSLTAPFLLVQALGFLGMSSTNPLHFSVPKISKRWYHGVIQGTPEEP